MARPAAQDDGWSSRAERLVCCQRMRLCAAEGDTEKVEIGLGRIVASHYRPSSSYQFC